MEMSATEYEDSLVHYGILRKSGRYPWGSGKDPLQRSKTFLDILNQHQKVEGLSEAEVAKLYDAKDEGFPFTVADLRGVKSRAINMKKRDDIRTAQRLSDKGMSPSAIGRQMGINESSVRSLLEPGRLDRLDILEQTANMLKRQVEEKGLIDVGAHVERDLPIGDNPETRIGISKDKFNTALSMLKEEGYSVHTFKGEQIGTGKQTTYRVLAKPGVTQKEAWLNRDKVQVISEKSTDGGHNYAEMSFQRPHSINSKRVGVRYKEDGGADADGVIYVRPGVKDVSLGKNQYAQVRVAVDDTHYLKGMAIYKDDLPRGIDLMVNVNKSSTGNKHDAFKPLKTDQEGNVNWKNPFGSFPKPGGQLLGKDGKPSSAMNILNEEGDWDKWSRNLSNQVLSKQSPSLVKSQLDVTYERRRDELEKIKALTNPLIKRRLLETFADETDSSAVYLKAANLPKQSTRVLFPVTSMKPHEVFAPTYENGTKVALVRYPHAGTFEIPQLTVNNKNPEARALFGIGKGKEGSAPDAIGIHPNVAERLSGADFDGDYVSVIPNNRGKIVSRDPLPGLKDFNPQQYKVPTPEEDPVNGYKTIEDAAKQNQMGRVTNLITDMTIKGATDEHLAAAVRHSMVVIDAEKHNLDYKESERDNGIVNLKKTYQGTHPGGQLKGAATLLTRARSPKVVLKRRDAKAGPGLTRVSNATIENKTGKKVYELTGERDKKGELKTFKSKKLVEAEDARTLLSEGGGTKVEQIYAAHSNRLKAMANDARKEIVVTKPKKREPSAARVYADEVASLNSKLNEALKNAPLERRAQSVAAQIVKQRRQANPIEMDAAEKRKIKNQALQEARIRTNAKKASIEITDREWDAIQAGAISIDKLSHILKNTDVDKLRERATPRDKPVMTPALTARAKSMRRSGITIAEIADALGVSPSTLQSGLGGE